MTKIKALCMAFEDSFRCYLDEHQVLHTTYSEAVKCALVDYILDSGDEQFIKDRYDYATENLYEREGYSASQLTNAWIIREAMGTILIDVWSRMGKLSTYPGEFHNPQELNQLGECPNKYQYK